MADCQDCGADTARYCKGCSNEAINDAIVNTAPIEQKRAWNQVSVHISEQAASEFTAGNDDRAKWLRDLSTWAKAQADGK